MTDNIVKKRRLLSRVNERKRLITTDLYSVNIGKVNFERWNEWKEKLNVDTDEKLAEKLLTDRLRKESESLTPANTDVGNGQTGTASSDSVQFKDKTDSGSFSAFNSQSGLFYKFGRYGKDFEEIERLGRGGFGSVYKSRNKLDENTYAVKKIRFTNSSPGNLEKVQREVTALAKLKHENIVRYNTSWLENDKRKIVKTVSDTSLSDKNWDSTANEGGVNYNFETDRRNNDFDEMKVDDKIEMSQGSKDSYTGSISISPAMTSVILYIQMELCSQALMEWMRERTDINLKDNIHICKQILKAVHYMHCEGIIHRDLKPNNVFLTEGLLVKVGDFGLAKEDLATAIAASPARSESSPALSTSDSIQSDHTSGVGTKTYAAPEQLDGVCYTFKCDIYSLGIIIFELFQITISVTQMERHKCLKSFREGEFPDTFRRDWPEQCELLETMTSDNPENRPSAEEILSTKMFSESSKTEESETIEELRKKIEELQLKLAEKEKENMRLKSMEN